MNNRINVVQGGAANSISDPSGEELRYQFGICRFVFFKNLTRRALNVKISSLKQVSFRRAILPASIIAIMAMSGSASAFKIDIDNEDIDMRWDNTFRYNAGWRMQDQKWDLGSLGSQPFYAASNRRFERGGMITNRLDILSEFDFIYKKDTGFRVSAAGWYDKRYDNHVQNENVFFQGGRNPDEVSRYYNGPSGEFLDAFVFTKFDFGNVPVNVKLGKHTVYWGETLFSLADGVSAGQSNADLRKALATPGVEAKEVFKPLNQFSFSAQLSPELTVMGQYFFDWQSDLFPLAGTYFSPFDILTYSGSTAFPGTLGWDGLNENGLKKSGDWGLATKWRPEWLDGTAGFYYREYTPKNGGAFVIDPSKGSPAPYFFGTAGIQIDPSLPRTKLLGFSLAKQVFGISWGMDLTYRKDANLLTKPFSTVVTPSNGGWAPYGDVMTAVFNMIAYDGKRGIGDFNFYDSAVITAEFNWDGIHKVTHDPLGLHASRNTCVTGTGFFGTAGASNQGYYGCQTGNNYGISFLVEPKWFQVFPGTDITMPLFYTVGLHGNSAIPAVGANEGMGAYSIGVTADVDAKYNFALKYNGNLYKRRTAPAPHGLAGAVPFSNAALGDFSDRNWLSLTAKATW